MTIPKPLAWLMLGVVVFAQSIVTIQGTDGPTRRIVAVDSMGRLLTVPSGGGGDTTVVGKAANGAAVNGNPVLVAGYDGTLTRTLRTDTLGRLVVETGSSSEACNLSLPVVIAATGVTEIIPLSGSTVIRVCHISFSGAVISDVVLTQGTGSACGTNTAAMSGTYQDVLALALDFASPIATTAGRAFCLSVTYSGGGALGGGVITYSQS